MHALKLLTSKLRELSFLSGGGLFVRGGDQNFFMVKEEGTIIFSQDGDLNFIIGRGLIFFSSKEGELQSAERGFPFSLGHRRGG